MSDRKLIDIDRLIAEAIKEDLDEIDIAEVEIEEEWDKLKAQLDQRRIKNRNKVKKIVAAAATIILCVSIAGIWIESDIFAGKTDTTKNTVEQGQGKTTLETNTSLEEPSRNEQDIKSNEQSEQMQMPIEEVRNIVNFNIRELPYKVEDCLAIKSDVDKYAVEITYRNERGILKLEQFMEGIDTTQVITFHQSADVKKIELNGVEYALAKLSEEKSKVTWTAFGIRYTLDIKYDIDQDEVMEIIKAMK